MLLFSSLRIDQVNKYLDQVAQSNVEHKREDVKKVLQLLLRNTSALEQVLIWSNSKSAIFFKSKRVLDIFASFLTFLCDFRSG